MKISAVAIFVVLFASFDSFAQKIAFVSTDLIREKFPDAQLSDQRIQTIVDEWKRELKEMDQLIEAKEFEIKKNRLIWTENERIQNDNELRDLRTQRMNFAKEKYSVGGEYEKIVKAIQQPVEEKIYAAIQKVAAMMNIDIVWDKSQQPLTYTNFKYDITVKVLKELGVNTAELEAQLDNKIKNDPRNSPENQSKQTPTKRTRKRRTEANEEQVSPNPDSQKLDEEKMIETIKEEPKIEELKRP